MRARDIADLSAKVLLAYYAGDARPFLDHCHEEVLWIGTAPGQVVRTREALRRVLAAETSHSPRFAVHNLTATPLAAAGSASCEVMLTFLVDTLWPDESTGRVDQRIQLSWTGCRDEPRILVCHVSDALACDSRKVAYPNHYAAAHGSRAAGTTGAPLERICLRGSRHTAVYLDKDDVIYAESKGAHALVHTEADTFEAAEPLSAIARRYPGLFVRVHASYLVNPAFVRGVSRCKVTLEGGAEVPVPEKRYTAVRAELASRVA